MNLIPHISSLGTQIITAILSFILSLNFLFPKTDHQFLFLPKGDILEGISTGPEKITIDFSRQISTGSPLIFGGAHAPNLEHQDAWDKLKDVGVTMIRRDFFLEYEVPSNITLSDYINNSNDIQNPDKWIQKSIQSTNQIYINAKKRDMKVMGILTYAPAWMTYSGTKYGVPRDWDVYEDIVKKSYTLHRKYLDYLEIWNEPDHKVFLDMKDTPYTKDAAYALIYFHAQKAIREVDKLLNDGKTVLIGGMVVSNPLDSKFFEGAFSKIITNSQFDFVTYHNYEQLSEPSYLNYKIIMNKYNKGNIPIFITEWNHNYRTNQLDSYHYTNLAVPYTGNKLVTFLNVGLAGANYFNMQMLDINKPNTYNGSFGFYTMRSGKIELLPQAKTWRLLSKTLGLGNGESKIMETIGPEEITSAGFINSKGKKGFAVVNDTDTTKLIEINLTHLTNTSIPEPISINVYIADKDHDGGTRVDRLNIVNNNKDTFLLKLPPQSVTGGIIVKGMDVLKNK